MPSARNCLSCKPVLHSHKDNILFYQASRTNLLNPQGSCSPAPIGAPFPPLPPRNNKNTCLHIQPRLLHEIQRNQLILSLMCRDTGHPARQELLLSSKPFFFHSA